MSLELNLHFPSPGQVIVRSGDEFTKTMEFKSPITAEDHQDIRWYLETYASQYTADVDDERADKIVARLPEWGEKLFHAVFSSITANKLFLEFYGRREQGRLLTISAEHPAILSLPWELLCVEGKHLFHEKPRISIRRRFAGAGGLQSLPGVETRERLRLLFVVSRPGDDWRKRWREGSSFDVAWAGIKKV